LSFGFDRRRIPGLGFKDLGLGFVKRRGGSTRREREREREKRRRRRGGAMKTVVGKVVSNKMTKSVVVAVQRLWQHPKYPKLVRRTSKFMAHDETNACNMGDEVGFPDPAFFFPVSERESFMYSLVVVTLMSLANDLFTLMTLMMQALQGAVCFPAFGVFS
jgi:small subunit ribosomal protein S17